MEKKQILVVDDDKDMCALLNRFLVRNGYVVNECSTGKAALDWLVDHRPSLVLCDFKLDDMNGTVILQHVRETFTPSIPFIIITGYSDVKAAVDIMKMGAYDYVTKPLFPDEILLSVKKALEKQQEPDTIPLPPYDNLKEEPVQHSTQKLIKVAAPSATYIFGTSPSFQPILKQLSLVSPTNFSVIIYGESGSGKEAIAREIHRLSKRNNKPFVAIDCGALSKELAASELFGHEKGSFTGALNQKIGSFEMANSGTVFLDEIANLPYDVQVSLLRVVQERKMRRVGGNKDVELDVRIVVASNEKLWDSAAKGKFREDLFHRFNEFSIDMPPLRQRREDIMMYAKFFLQQTNAELDKHVKGFTTEVEKIFMTYQWFGNLRELKNVVKRATLLSESEYIEATSLPFEITHHNKLQFTPQPEELSERSLNEDDVAMEQIPTVITAVPKIKKDINPMTLKSASIDAEYETILEALKKVNFNKSKAAQLLNIDRKTLYNKMKEYQQFNHL